MNDSSPSPRDAARGALRAAGESLGYPTGPERVFQALEDRAEAFELGVGVRFAPGSGRGLVVYYNPRARTDSYRARSLETLRNLGLDTDLVERAYGLIPVERVSTVLAVEWNSTRAPSATIYFEEVSRSYSEDEAARATADLAALADTRAPDETRRVGSLYIWALDLTPAESPAFKIYRHVPANALDAVRAELCDTVAAPAPLKWIDDALFSRTVGSDFIVQRRYAHDASVASHKVYRSFPYQTGNDDTQSTAQIETLLTGSSPSPGPESRELIRLFLAAGETGEPLFRPTNVALAFAPGKPQPRYGTAYWALWSNRPPRDVAQPANGLPRPSGS